MAKGTGGGGIAFDIPVLVVFCSNPENAVYYEKDGVILHEGKTVCFVPLSAKV